MDYIIAEWLSTILYIFIGIIFSIIISILGALILWCCARVLGKIKRATFLNSWGLFWILIIAPSSIAWLNSCLNIRYKIFFLSSEDLIFIFAIILCIVFYIIHIWVALEVTRVFWKCTLKQAIMTHIIPILLYNIGYALFLVWLHFSGISFLTDLVYKLFYTL